MYALNPDTNNPMSDLNEQIQSFMHDHPEVKEALDLFGIADDHYQRFLAVQTPVFYTSRSTTGGGLNGELD